MIWFHDEKKAIDKVVPPDLRDFGKIDSSVQDRSLIKKAAPEGQLLDHSSSTLMESVGQPSMAS